jgi:hypothetical protein
VSKYDPEAYLPVLGPITGFKEDFRWDKDEAIVMSDSIQIQECPECHVLPYIVSFSSYDEKLKQNFQMYRYACPKCKMREMIGWWTISCLGARLGWQSLCVTRSLALDKRK